MQKKFKNRKKAYSWDNIKWYKNIIEDSEGRDRENETKEYLRR